jgi:formyltetrahydrofolate synthetase
MKPSHDIARGLDLDPRYVEPYGHSKAKIALGAMPAGGPSRGKLILVSAITPTPAGEGKTTTSVGLAQGLACNGVRAAVAKCRGKAPLDVIWKLGKPELATWWRNDRRLSAREAETAA